ncbi:SMI1/KNR4 family protein [Streptomyces sp. O3]
MAVPVAHSWERIDNWLRQFAPYAYGDLLPPATCEEIAATEERLGLRFPPELVESLMCHNGGDETFCLAGVFRLMSVASIADDRLYQLELAEEVQEDNRAHGNSQPIEGQYAVWHPMWVPFASSGGWFLFIDSRAEPYQSPVGYRDELGEAAVTRKQRQEFGENFCTPEQMWSSLPDLLECLADVLESGGVLAGKRPIVVDGGLEWEDPDDPEEESSWDGNWRKLAAPPE